MALLDFLRPPVAQGPRRASPYGPFQEKVADGNIDLESRPMVRMPDGSFATVRSMSFRNNAGEEVLVPTVSPDGRIMSDLEAKEHYGKTKQHLGKFATPQAADQYAQALHLSQEKFYEKQSEPKKMGLLDFLRPQQAQIPMGVGAPGEIRRGPGGRNYQYAQTTGMAGAAGDQGWIPTSMKPEPTGLGRLLAPEVALPMAAMLMGGQGNSANLGNAFAIGGQALGQQKELQAQTAKENQTANWLRTQDPKYVQMLDNGLPASEVYKLYAADRNVKPTRNEYEERTAAAQQYGLQGDEATSFVLTGQLPTGRFGSAEVGLQPIPVYDEKGGVRFFQPTKSGPPVEMEFPEGYRPLSPFDTSFQKSSGVAAGKGQGEAQELYQSMSSKMPGLRHVVGQLDQLSEKATYTLGGQALDQGMRQLGMDPRESAVAREQYIAMVNNQILPMLRDTFGAQFTVAEGESLKATLGAPNKSPQEKQAVLKAFIEQKERDIAALAERTGQVAPMTAPAGDVLDYTDYFTRP